LRAVCARATALILAGWSRGAAPACAALIAGLVLAAAAPAGATAASFDALSCASAGSFCVAVSSDGYATTYERRAWSQPAVIDPGAHSGTSALSGVSCGSPALCVAFDDESGDVFVERSGSWSGPAAVDSGGGGFQALSCASSSFCLAVDYAGQGLTYDGSTWSTPGPAYTDGTVASLSCASPSFCLAADDLGNVAEGTGGPWGSSTKISSAGTPVDLVACASRSFCAAAAGTTLAFYDKGSWGKPTTVAGEGASALSCTTAPLCLAVDGGVLEGSGRRWTSVPGQLTGPSPRAVSCSGSACVVLDSTGSAVLDARGAWSELAALPGEKAFRPAGLVKLGRVHAGRTVVRAPVHCLDATCRVTLSLRSGTRVLASVQRTISAGHRATIKLAPRDRALELLITEAGVGTVARRHIAFTS
jgi:hypothetical protein